MKNKDSVKLIRKEIGMLLFNRRIELGCTAEEISEAAGISVATLTKIEKGLFAWDIDLHNQLLLALELKMEYKF